MPCTSTFAPITSQPHFPLTRPTHSITSSEWSFPFVPVSGIWYMYSLLGSSFRILAQKALFALGKPPCRGYSTPSSDEVRVDSELDLEDGMGVSE